MIAPLHALFAAVLLLTPVLAAEVGTRVLIEADRLPLAPSSNAFLDISLANLVRHGQPDVLVLGTSAARAAIRPSVLEGLIADAIGQPVEVRSMAQGGIDLEDQRLLIEGLDGLGLLPSTVVLPVTLMTATGRHPDGGWFVGSELGQLWSTCAAVEDPTSTLECWVGQGSALWRWRDHPQQLIDAVTDSQPRTYRDKQRTLHKDGWVETRPASPRTMRAALPAAVDELGADVGVPDFAAADFAAVVGELRERGVTVVAIEMPYADQLQQRLLAQNPDWLAQRRAAYQSLEDASGIEVIELERFGEWVDDASFRDHRHLSHRAAGPFTRQLWAMPEFRRMLLSGLGAAGLLEPAGQPGGLGSGD